MEEKFIMGNVATMSDQGAHNMRNEIRQPLTKEGWKPGQPESCGVVIESGPPVPSEVIYQEYQDGKLTYEVTAPRADLVRAVEARQVMRIMPLVACPEAPRPAAKPRSKSGQRRAHARWGR